MTATIFTTHILYNKLCYAQDGASMSSSIRYASPKKYGRINETFARVERRLALRCGQLNRTYRADIYFAIRRHRYYEYKSTTDPTFPLTSVGPWKSCDLMWCYITSIVQVSLC